MRAAVVIPTYNEQENIERLLSALLALPLPLHVIVVDDNSPDGTGASVDRMAAQDARVIAIHRPAKLGLGTAHIAGMRLALERGMDLVLTMDADFSHDPKHVPALVALCESRDLAIGSRYVPGGGTRNCSLFRRGLSRSANAFSRLLLGLRARDCTAGYRCYRRSVLEALDLDQVHANGYSFLIELLHRVQQSGFSVGEVPIVFVDRRFGTSKISKHEVGRALLTVFRLLLAPRRGRAA
jgi:glycosyltransferase involved in cell wall biosynthesis